MKRSISQKAKHKKFLSPSLKHTHNIPAETNIHSCQTDLNEDLLVMGKIVNK